MLTAIAIFSVRRRRLVLVGSILLAIVLGGFGATAVSRLMAGGFVSADAESSLGTQYLNEQFGSVQPNMVVTVTVPEGVDSLAGEAAGQAAVDTLGSRGDIEGIQSFWDMPTALQASLRSEDENTALVVGHIPGDETQIQKVAKSVTEQISELDGATFKVGGYAAALNDANTQILKDLIVAEAVALPLAAIVLVMVFGSLVAAMVPLVVGIFAIASTFAILRAFTTFTDVSIFALNMTTALALAVAVDYSLFVVSRYREELATGVDYEAAAITAVRTAGRTVWFSAVAVGIGLCAVVVYPMYFLRSLAYTGMAVVFAAALASIVITPALLVALGPRINQLDLAAWFRRVTGRPAREQRDPIDTRWYRTAMFAMKRPIPVALAIVGLLLLVGAPFLSLNFGYPDDRMVRGDSAQSRQVGDILREDFAQNAEATTYVALPGFDGSADELGAYASALSKVPGVSGTLSSEGVFLAGLRVATAPGEFRNSSGAVIGVASELDPYSQQASDQLVALTSVPAPSPPIFTGSTVMNRDFVDGIVSGIPMVVLLMVISTFVVLFVFTGGVILPIKALIINALSVTAAMGAMVWIFQEGHLSGLLGFTPTGYLPANIPVLMFCILFGISMDYEVFLLSRVREEWLSSAKTAEDNVRSVAVGVARTGRIFTAAAILMVIALGAMSLSKVTFIQMFGVGLALTALVDATVIRLLLVPAFMRLAGRWNWWAPGPLRRFHDRIGFGGEEVVPAPAPQVTH